MATAGLRTTWPTKSLSRSETLSSNWLIDCTLQLCSKSNFALEFSPQLLNPNYIYDGELILIRSDCEKTKTTKRDFIHLFIYLFYFYHGIILLKLVTCDLGWKYTVFCCFYQILQSFSFLSVMHPVRVVTLWPWGVKCAVDLGLLSPGVDLTTTLSATTDTTASHTGTAYAVLIHSSIHFRLHGFRWRGQQPK